MLTGSCLIAKHYYEKFKRDEKEKNSTIVQEKYEHTHSPIFLILGLAVLFIEISLAIFI